MIQNGKDLAFGQASAGLPDVSVAIMNLFQPVIVGIIKPTQVDGYTQTIISKRIQTRGVRIQNSNQLVMSKSGERIWDSMEIYFLRGIELVADDLFLFQDTQYRVIATEEWADYGFNRYTVVQDYTKIYNPTPNVI